MSSAVVDLTGSEFEIEALPEGNALGCWASAACAASASCPASTASTASTASSASQSVSGYLGACLDNVDGAGKAY